jgi:hypothetical protein
MDETKNQENKKEENIEEKDLKEEEKSNLRKALFDEQTLEDALIYKSNFSILQVNFSDFEKIYQKNQESLKNSTHPPKKKDSFTKIGSH